MTSITTQDGTVLLFDPEIGVVSATSREEAEAEVRRRKAANRARQRSAA